MGVVIVPNFASLESSGLPLHGGFCCWNLKPRPNNKPAKVPLNERGQALSVTSPERWLSYEDAKAAYISGKFNGIGVLMNGLPDWVGLDLDAVLNSEGHVVEGAVDIVSDLLDIGGYVEVSPSGTGLRVFIQATKPEGLPEKVTAKGAHSLEIYDSRSARYLTLTGYPFAEVRKEFSQSAFDDFISQWFGDDSGERGRGLNNDESAPADTDQRPVVSRSADEVRALLNRHNKRGAVTRLLAGNISDQDDDHSKADMALCCEIAYFSRDPEVVDEVFRASGLMREKWDSKRGRSTYGADTVAKALKLQIRNYDEDRAAKQNATNKIKSQGSYLVGGASDLVNAKGQLKGDLHTLTELLIRDKRLIGCVYMDTFASLVTVLTPLSEAFSDPCAPHEIGVAHDEHSLALQAWFGRTWGLDIRKSMADNVMIRWASKIQRNPVAERLEELEKLWDGKPRLGDWLMTYCKAKTLSDDGVDITDYVAAIGRRWLVGAVARAMNPGCKFDSMLVLEGKQGARKSSAVRVIGAALGEEHFREGFSLNSGKDDMIALRGRHTVEWSELAGLSRKDSAEIKNFLTLRTDSYRGQYMRFERDYPRTAVFIGTTNDAQYLNDATGARRFWPVTVGAIDLDRLTKDIDQIWAEAVHAWRQGERWWFDEREPKDVKLIKLAEGEQRQRAITGLWDETAHEMAERLVCGQLIADETKTPADPYKSYPVSQIKQWLAGSQAEVDDNAWLRVTRGLRRSGWESKKTGGRMVWYLSVDRRTELFVRFGISEPSLNLRKAVAKQRKNTGKTAKTS